MTVIKLSFLLAASVLMAAACGDTATNTAITANTTTKTATTPATASPTVAAVAIEPTGSGDGKELYATNCMICHKENGTGGRVTIKGKNLKPENLTEDKFKKATDDKLIAYVVDGVPDEGMPSFKGKLDDEQIKAIIAHVRTLQQ